MDPQSGRSQKAEAIATWSETALLWVASIHKVKENLFIPWAKNYWPDAITPNIITLFRIGMCFVLIVVLDAMGWRIYRPVILPLFVAIVCTDFLDGLVARAKGLVSALGSLLDKIADRLLIAPIAFAEFWPTYKALVIFGLMGMAVTTAVTVINYFRQHPREVPDDVIAKTAMILFSIAVILALWQSLLPLAHSISWIGMACATFSFGYIKPKRLKHLLVSNGSEHS
jgi:phosphatidylglycerophosphate synthase